MSAKPSSAENNLSYVSSVGIVDRRVEAAPSPWAICRAKRVLDIILVLAAAPVFCPLLLAIATAVRISSSGPILFRQFRIGAFGRPFVIFKFRTMRQSEIERLPAVAASFEDQVTRIGRILRRTKLDELPQVINVLIGNMSLVGPRPRIFDQQLASYSVRPGITGAATLVFANEEKLFAQIPAENLAHYYRRIILPAKHRLDADYAQRSTLISDMVILLSTLMCCWGRPASLAACSLMDTAIVQISQDVYEA